MSQLPFGFDDRSSAASTPAERPVPKAPRYPAWVPDDDDARFRYDLSLALAAEALAEPPDSVAAQMAAEVVYRMPQPTV